MRLWDVSSGKPVGEFLAEKHPVSTRPFFVLVFADSGQPLRVFDLLTGKLHGWTGSLLGERCWVARAGIRKQSLPSDKV